jgi:hypothetical protein
MTQEDYNECLHWLSQTPSSKLQARKLESLWKKWGSKSIPDPNGWGCLCIISQRNEFFNHFNAWFAKQVPPK